jgi:hypothetical protein
MARVIRPPQALPDGFAIFLAGSIEDGRAENWQLRVEHELAQSDVILFNPRRDDWDPTWKQALDDPHFREQVEWELSALEQADFIAMYFAPGTKSPITLLELGLFARSGRLVVCCPAGFWRKGNVDIACARYQVRQVGSLDDLVGEVSRTAARKSSREEF